MYFINDLSVFIKGANTVVNISVEWEFFLEANCKICILFNAQTMLSSSAQNYLMYLKMKLHYIF